MAVIVSTTMASVMELEGRFTEPLIYKLVEVIEVAERFAGEKFVAESVVKKALVDVILVPLALPKLKLVIVPTVVRFGNEVEAAIVRYVLEARA